MSDKSRIEWCDATWNPVVGCSPVSHGCDHCYAARMAHRLGSNPATPQFAGLTVDGKWTGEVRHVWKVLGVPFARRKPQRIFVCSMGDLFHESVSLEYLDQVFAVMAQASQHTFMLLTKRPARMREYLLGLQNDPEQAWRFEQQMQCQPNPLHRFALGFRRGKPLPNVWLGVTAEDQQRADERIPILLETPAAKRFVSGEPMLGPVRFDPLWLCPSPSTAFLDGRVSPDMPAWTRIGCIGLDWVIAGGETGPGARPAHPDWFRSLRDQCAAAGVPFLLKQWGDWVPASDCGQVLSADANIPAGFEAERFDWMDGGRAYRVGKHRAGRLLDGAMHNAFPEVQS